jgi:hypothetical protein
MPLHFGRLSASSVSVPCAAFACPVSGIRCPVSVSGVRVRCPRPVSAHLVSGHLVSDVRCPVLGVRCPVSVSGVRCPVRASGIRIHVVRTGELVERGCGGQPHVSGPAGSGNYLTRGSLSLDYPAV